MDLIPYSFLGIRRSSRIKKSIRDVIPARLLLKAETGEDVPVILSRSQKPNFVTSTQGPDKIQGNSKRRWFFENFRVCVNYEAPTN